MSNPSLDELPILRELGDDLKNAFRAGEATAKPRSRRPRVRSRWLLGVGGLATAAVGAVLAFVVGVQGGSPSLPSATAALVQAAAAAEVHPVPFPRDDQFYYVRSVSTGLQVIRSNPTTPLLSSMLALPKAAVTIESRLWFSADRTGVTKSRLVSVRFRTTADRRLWERLGRPSFAPQGPARGPTAIAPLGHGHYLLGNLELARRQLLATSTEPRTLYARLYAAGGSPAEVFTEISDTLRNRPAPAALRAALYRTLALVPGIRLVGPATDSAGRRGTAVGFARDGVEDQLIFDSGSSDMLAEQSIVLRGGAKQFGLPAGTVLSSTAYMQRAVTDSPTQP
jgi:hypothetical protein